MTSCLHILRTWILGEHDVICLSGKSNKAWLHFQPFIHKPRTNKHHVRHTMCLVNMLHDSMTDFRRPQDQLRGLECWRYRRPRLGYPPSCLSSASGNLLACTTVWCTCPRNLTVYPRISSCMWDGLGQKSTAVIWSQGDKADKDPTN